MSAAACTHGRCSGIGELIKRKPAALPEDRLGMGMGLTAHTKIDWRKGRAQPRSSAQPMHIDVRML
jgi:hypothetical protein